MLHRKTLSPTCLDFKYALGNNKLFPIPSCSLNPNSSELHSCSTCGFKKNSKTNIETIYITTRHTKKVRPTHFRRQKRGLKHTHSRTISCPCSAALCRPFSGFCRRVAPPSDSADRHKNVIFRQSSPAHAQQPGG